MDLIIQAIYEHIIILVDYLLINTRETCYNCFNVIGIVSDLKQNWLQIFDNIVHEHACTKKSKSLENTQKILKIS